MSGTRPRRWGAALVSGLMAVTVAAVTPQVASAAVTPKEAQRLKSVPGSVVPVKPITAGKGQELRGTPAVVWPSGTADVALTGARARAGKLPVWVRGKDAESDPRGVRLQVLGQAESARRGVDGVLVRIGRTDDVKRAAPVALSVDYTGFRHAYGGDWASRLTLVPLDGAPAPGPVRNDVAAGTLSADVPASAASATYAVTADPEGPSGDYKATSLQAAGDWDVSEQSGSFSWNYGLRVPPVPGGLAPELRVAYNSASVDGRVATANNQTSWVGEGWDLSPGFVERRYRGCTTDLGGNQGQTKTGDLCWGVDNATLSLPGRGGELVRDAAGRWHLKNDDGSRVERLSDAQGADNGDDNREYWRLTTTDGTRYTFGLNKMPDGRPDTNSAWTVPVVGNHPGEACHRPAYGDSFCRQAYRWNLDKVEDRHGNTVIYSYDAETNKYGKDLAKSADWYVRGGTLRRIDYGTRDGVAGDAPARVLFDVADRCAPGANCAAKTTASWPDVPWDQECAGATCPEKHAPTFWSTKRLAAVTTQIRKPAGYQDVERWTFDQSFPTTGDTTSPALWLKGIGHSGLVRGVASTPAVTFTEDPLNKANRVNGAADGLPPGNKNRVRSIHLDSGGQIDVNYAPVNCAAGGLPAPDTNTARCFPVRWAPDKVMPIDDWYHRYVVASVARIDRVGGAPTQFTSYDYEGGAAWAYRDDPLVEEKYRSWTDWRGYEKVRVREGDPNNPADRTQNTTRYQYFRGMNGDRLKAGGTKSVTVAGIADNPPLAGFLRELTVYNGLNGPEVSATVNDPKVVETAAQGPLKAHIVRTAATYERTALASGGPRRAEARMTYDDAGLMTKVDDLGDVADPNDDQCTTTTYVRNSATWLLSLRGAEVKVGVSCSAPVSAGDVISDQRFHYDNLPFGAAPTTGDLTKVEALTSPGVYSTRQRTTYDQYGRPLVGHDAMDRKTTTAYQSESGLLTATTVTNALGHTTTTAVDPEWGTTVAAVDAGGSRTDIRLDPLGRIAEVWEPGRSRAGGQGPTVRYEYGLRADGASWISSQRLRANSNYVTTIQLFDGFLRERQTQEPSPQGGRTLTDTLYGTRGQVVATNAEYYNDSAPSTTLFAPDDVAIPQQTVHVHDGAGRETKETYEKFNEPQWSTTTAYSGDHVTVTPPQGGTPTTTYTDLRGNVTEVRLHADGTTTSTKRTYTRAGHLATVTDHLGNVWSYGYDLLGNRVRADDPDKGTTTTTVNAAGQPVRTTDARGQATVNVYDALGRRTELRKDSETGAVLASWSYDAVRKGQLDTTTRFVDGNAYASKVTSFDPANRPVGVSVVIPDSEGELKGTYSATTTYLADGSVGSATVPALGGALPAETIVNSYDALGLPTKVKAGTTTYASAAVYTALGELTQLQLGPDGSRLWHTTYYQEGTRRPESSLVERETATAVRADQTTYTYDPIGNVTGVETLTAGSPVDRQCLAYDGKRQLTEAWTSTAACATPGATLGGPAPYWNSYRSDALGRRTSLVRHGLNGAPDNAVTTTYPEAGSPQPNGPASISSTAPGANGTYTYDQAGNTTSRPVQGGNQTYTWDAEGQLSSATAGGVTTTYITTPEGQRLLAKRPDSTTLYLASGELKLDKATRTVTGTRYYRHGDKVIASRTASKINYLIEDEQGTATLAVDASTLTHTKRRLDPYGVPRTQSTWPTSQGYVGGTTDPSTALTRLGVRDYDPNTGSFLSGDPLLDETIPQHLNAYTYSFNNPTTFRDPAGTKPICNKFGDCRMGHDDAHLQPEKQAAERKRREQVDREWRATHERRNKPGLAVDKGGNVQVGRKGKSLAQQENDIIAAFNAAVKQSKERAWAPEGYNVARCWDLPLNALLTATACFGADRNGVFASLGGSAKMPISNSQVPTKLFEKKTPQISDRFGLGPITEGWSPGRSISVPAGRHLGVKLGTDENLNPKTFSYGWPAPTSPSISGTLSYNVYMFRWR